MANVAFSSCAGSFSFIFFFNNRFIFNFIFFLLPCLLGVFFF